MLRDAVDSDLLADVRALEASEQGRWHPRLDLAGDDLDGFARRVA